jgi:hypothetical protein
MRYRLMRTEPAVFALYNGNREMAGGDCYNALPTGIMPRIRGEDRA